MKNASQHAPRFGFRSMLVFVLTLVLSGGLLVGCGSGADQTNESESRESDRDVRDGTVRSIENADRDIESETVARSVRVGLSLNEPSTIYKAEKVASDPEGTDRQVRVVLREERTKRKLSGAEVQVQFLDENGNGISSTYLLETWGDYYFYGKNLSVPEEAASFRVNVTPPLIGRHEDMKELYLEPVTTEVDLSRSEGSLTVEGSSPDPVGERVRLGSDVETAVEEALALKQNGRYRIGFIAEEAEPFWVFTRHENDDKSPRSLKMADFPQSANRHLEIVLFDRETHRIVPHAGVTLDVEATDGDARAEVELPFLMSAFNHYGNSLYLPQTDYRVDVSVKAPDLHTLEKGRFPAEASASFDWTPAE